MSVCAITKNENDQCAPAKKNEDGSCIGLNILVSIAEAYNDEHSDKIKFDINKSKNQSDYKKYLVEELEQRLGKDQRKWIDKKIISKLKKEEQYELKKRTFAPKGPQGTWEWLNTLHIEEVMSQYEDVYPNFKFLGAVPIDFYNLDQLGINKMNFARLREKGKAKIGIVFNLDEHWKSGSHWVSAFFDLKKGKLYFFDSYGSEPDDRVTEFMQRVGTQLYKEFGITPQLMYNRTRHQYGSSECGVYSISFILQLLKGKKFEDISTNPIPDDDVSACRKVYFVGQ